MRAANVKRYDRRKLQALRILHEELENVRARASLHGRGFALSHTSHLKHVQIAKKASTRLKAKKKTKGEITTTMVRTRARELPSHRTGPDPTRHAHAFRSL